LKLGEVINEFDVAKQMKVKLMSKDTIKFKESEMTKFELRDRQEVRKDITKSQKVIMKSQVKLKNFKKLP
jgi:hypothetical protein